MKFVDQLTEERTLRVQVLSEMITETKDLELKKRLFKKLTVAEQILLGIGATAGQDKGVDALNIEAVEAELDRILEIYTLIGVPVHTPIDQLNKQQQELIESHADKIQAVFDLIKLWDEANKGKVNPEPKVEHSLFDVDPLKNWNDYWNT